MGVDTKDTNLKEGLNNTATAEEEKVADIRKVATNLFASSNESISTEDLISAEINDHLRGMDIASDLPQSVRNSEVDEFHTDEFTSGDFPKLLIKADTNMKSLLSTLSQIPTSEIQSSKEIVIKALNELLAKIKKDLVKAKEKSDTDYNNKVRYNVPKKYSSYLKGKEAVEKEYAYSQKLIDAYVDYGNLVVKYVNKFRSLPDAIAA